MLGIRQEQRIRWFSFGVTLGLILVCNAMLLLGLWASGLNLDWVFSESEFYEPTKGYCVKVTMAQVIDSHERVRLCSEWLEMSDPTGQVHTLREGEPIAYGEDGKFHYESEPRSNAKLLALLVFVVLVIGSGMWLKRYLIAWYRLRLQATGEKVG